jgi:polysaccharide biosynthesis/export protein
MATMCRVTMARSKAAFRGGLFLLLGVVLPPALISAPGNAQTAGSASFQSSGISSASSSGRPGNAPQSGAPLVVPKDLSELRIEPGDLLGINIYDTPEFTSSYRVDLEGNLLIPLCGKVNVRGLTLTEAAKRIETALRDGQILVHPQVNVDVQQYAGQYVTVTGEITTPGRIALIAPTHLGEILAQAGGVTPLAGARIKIRHGDGNAEPEIEVPYSRSQGNHETASILVRPGDAVIVPRAGIVYVLGAVNRPGGYVMQEDGKLNIAEALALSGGTLLQANTGGTRVIRRNPDGTVQDFPVSYDAIAKGTQTPLLLQAQDIVYVPMSKIKATFASTSGLISTAASAAIYTLR